jgi:hypothetical protein
MRSAHPVAVIALYAVLSVGVVALVLEAMFWWSRWRAPRPRVTTGEYDRDHIRDIARQRLRELKLAEAAKRTTT